MGACSDEFAKASNYGYWWIIAKGKSEELAKKWAETETFTETQKFAYGTYAVATVAPFEYLDPASLDLAYLQLFDTGTKSSLESLFLTRSKDSNLGVPKNFTTYVTNKRTPFVEFCELAPKDILCGFFPDKNFVQ